jgi:hypothetical protein
MVANSACSNSACIAIFIAGGKAVAAPNVGSSRRSQKSLLIEAGGGTLCYFHATREETE